MLLIRMSQSQFRELSLLNQYLNQHQMTWVSSHVLAVETEDNNKNEVLAVFKAILQEGYNELTVLISYQADDFSLYLLNLLHLSYPGKVYPLGDGFLIANSVGDAQLLNKAQQLYASFPQDLMNVVNCYCYHQGSLNACAQALYLHRNTINLKINQFILETNIDLRDFEIRWFMRILKTLLFGVQ